MTENAHVRLLIPFSSQEGFDDAIVFSQWGPFAQEDIIEVDSDEFSLKLQFGLECTTIPVNVFQEQLVSTFLNISVVKVIAFVTIKNLSEDLIRGILEPDHIHQSLESMRSNPHRELAQRTVDFVLNHVNRMISYIRYEKGQYALQEIITDPDNIHSTLVRFKAKIKCGDSDWREWDPPALGGVWKSRTYKRERLLSRDDWRVVKDRVLSSSRTPLVKQLLAGAELLAELNHRKAALTEAVTALEVAIHDFARSPKSQDAFGHSVLIPTVIPWLLRRRFASLGRLR